MHTPSLRALAPLVLSCLALATAGCAASAGNGEDVGSSAAAVSGSNNRIAFDYFTGKGLTAVQAAGIVGNLDQESGMNPDIWQYGGGPGRGIAQWSAGGRWDSVYHDNVVWYAEAHGASRYSLELQLEFIWYELETFHSDGLASLRAAHTISEATTVFQDDYERCGACDSSQRIAFAQIAYDDYHVRSGGGGGGGSSAKGCYSDTLAREMPANACVQSKYDDAWYQCDNGAWVDRWTDPAACDGIYPL
jgi:predicted small secreted protein